MTTAGQGGYPRARNPAQAWLRLMLLIVVSSEVGVVIHELGHVAAAWATGARVSTVHIGFLDGSVGIPGYDSVTQRWVIAAAGAVALVAAAALAIAAGSELPRLPPAARHALVAGGALQIVLQLVAQPLSTLGDWSDWRVIYRFSATPGLCWAAAVFHLFVLAELGRWWLLRLRPVLRGVASGVDAERRELESALRRRPGDVEARVRLARLFVGLGEPRAARRALDGATADDPAAGVALVAAAVLEGRWDDVVTASEGRARGSDQYEQLTANRAVALVHLGRYPEAVAAYAELSPPLSTELGTMYWRGIARLQAGDRDGGNVDLRAVRDRAPGRNLLGAHVDALLAGNPSRWRGAVLDLLTRPTFWFLWRRNPSPASAEGAGQATGAQDGDHRGDGQNGGDGDGHRLAGAGPDAGQRGHDVEGTHGDGHRDGPTAAPAQAHGGHGGEDGDHGGGDTDQG